MTTDDRSFNVLFLCTGNSARSIIAEAILEREGMGRFAAYSAGSRLARQVTPHALDLLRSLNHDIARFRSKDWSAFAEPDAPPLDFVFTVCDSAAQEVAAAFADIYRMLTNRISIFVNLPIRSLDKLALQERLDDIGRTGRAS